MARKTTIIIGLLVAVGFVVAMLPAQEARRAASVYNVTSDDPAGDLSPVAEPNLVPVEAAPSAAPPPTALPSTAVAQAGVLGRRRASSSGSLSNQLRASSEAASQEYTPTPATPSASTSIYQPAEISPPSSAVPMPTPSAGPELAPIIDSAEALQGAAEPPALAPPADLPGSDADAAAPREATAATPGQMRSVLKKAKTAPSNEAGRPVITPVNPPAAPRGGASSRRSMGGASSTSGSAIARRPAASVTGIDTRSITQLAVSGRSPSLRVDVAGPQGIMVGKPAVYTISLINEGETTAQEVQLRLALPGFVTVSGSNASNGEAMLHADGRMLWTLPALGARAHETLRLDLVASEGQPFDLNVEWACRPTAAQASIVVKQAQLQLSLAGPADMIFGDEKAFTLTVANPGNGDAENVVVNVSSGGNRRQQVDVGVVPAGEQREVPLKIVASEAGEMEIHTSATGEGGLEASAAGKVMVRKAELAIAVEGPELKYAGTEASFRITVQNMGNAPADNIAFSAALPAGAKYLGGLEGATPAAASLKWKLANLPAGSERSYDLRLVLNSAGANRLAVQAQGAAGLAATGEAETLVEAAADLKLVVNDPAGPLPTSEFAVYEVQVMNRGSEAARQVKIVMQFGEGIEPVAFDGCEARIVPGQVVCHPLAQLDAGEQISMRVKARAERGGTHQFRVEVTSDESESRLVSEGTTKFFAESGRTAAAAAATARKPSTVPQPGTLPR